MKVGCYVTVDDGDNYVTFHGLNVGIKIKTITKAQFGSVSNRELKRGLNRTAVLFIFKLFYSLFRLKSSLHRVVYTKRAKESEEISCISLQSSKRSFRKIQLFKFAYSAQSAVLFL